MVDDIFRSDLYTDQVPPRFSRNNAPQYPPDEWCSKLAPPPHNNTPLQNVTQYNVLPETNVKFMVRYPKIESFWSSRSDKARLVVNAYEDSIDVDPFDIHFKTGGTLGIFTRNPENYVERQENHYFKTYTWDIKLKKPGFYSFYVFVTDDEGEQKRFDRHSGNKYSWSYDILVHEISDIKQWDTQKLLNFLGDISTLYFAGSISKHIVKRAVRVVKTVCDEPSEVYEQADLDEFVQSEIQENEYKNDDDEPSGSSKTEDRH